jgi:hypothetical protein
MTSQHDKVKRRQFGMKECLLLTALVAMPIAAFRLAISLSPGPVAITLVVAAVGMTAGVVVGLLCWAITGSRKWFVIGYGLAGIFCAVASYIFLTFNVYRNSDEEIRTSTSALQD